MKSVTIRYFAVLKERRGLSDEVWKTTATTISDLIRELIVAHKLGLPPALIRAAVNANFVDDNFELFEGVEIVLIPPVAGG